ncbi:hypothetical protein ACWGJT_17835 [Streptomyces xantholiticus]
MKAARASDGAGNEGAGVRRDRPSTTAGDIRIMGRLSGLPAVLRLESHLTMKKIKADG